jgi:hypothetical protein
VEAQGHNDGASRTDESTQQGEIMEPTLTTHLVFLAVFVALSTLAVLKVRPSI